MIHRKTLLLFATAIAALAGLTAFGQDQDYSACVMKVNRRVPTR